MKRSPLALITLISFLITGIIGPMPAYGSTVLNTGAQEIVLPVPGVMVHLSPEFSPAVLKGIKVHPDNPFKFDFILDKGDSQSNNDQLKEEATRLIKYFLASLTIPEKDLWVNLSPYEKDRIIPYSFGLTEMGRDLLAEDYMLKQITASLIYPEDEVGKRFWKRIYEEAQKKFGTTQIPVNTFNKVWIVPEKAVVYENAKAGTAYVVESKLKVMLEQDYLALEKNVVGTGVKQPQNNASLLGSQIVREVVIPELTTEINENKNFATLRQVYNSLILATWYKKKIKDSILSQVYTNKNKVAGVNIDDPQETNNIYGRYLQAFKKGVYNYIKEDIDPMSHNAVPRKYFSGGLELLIVPLKFIDEAMIPQGDTINKHQIKVSVDLAMSNLESGQSNPSNTSGDVLERMRYSLLERASSTHESILKAIRNAGLQIITDQQPGDIRPLSNEQLIHIYNLLEKKGLGYLFSDGFKVIHTRLSSAENMQDAVRGVLAVENVSKNGRLLRPMILLTDMPRNVFNSLVPRGLRIFFGRIHLGMRTFDLTTNQALNNAANEIKRRTNIPPANERTYLDMMPTAMLHEIGESIYTVLEAESAYRNDRAIQLIKRWEAKQRQARHGVAYVKNMEKLSWGETNYHAEMFADKFALFIDSESIMYRFGETLDDEERRILEDIIQYFNDKNATGTNVFLVHTDQAQLAQGEDMAMSTKEYSNNVSGWRFKLAKSGSNIMKWTGIRAFLKRREYNQKLAKLWNAQWEDLTTRLIIGGKAFYVSSELRTAIIQYDVIDDLVKITEAMDKIKPNSGFPLEEVFELFSGAIKDKESFIRICWQLVEIYKASNGERWIFIYGLKNASQGLGTRAFQESWDQVVELTIACGKNMHILFGVFPYDKGFIFSSESNVPYFPQLIKIAKQVGPENVLTLFSKGMLNISVHYYHSFSFNNWGLFIRDWPRLFEMAKQHENDFSFSFLKPEPKSKKQRNKRPLEEYYQILGVSSTASIDEIIKAYKRLAAQYHPERVWSELQSRLIKLFGKNAESIHQRFRTKNNAISVGESTEKLESELFADFPGRFSVIETEWKWFRIERIKREEKFKEIQEAYKALSDSAMLISLEPASNFSSERKLQNGGIDLAATDDTLQTQRADREIKFHFDAAMLAKLQNAPGFVPVIINITPMTNLKEFLGGKG